MRLALFLVAILAIAPLTGCLDSLSDEELELLQPGCTYEDAVNYSEAAGVDDGSCLYDAGCIGGPGVPYWLNDTCYAWVIMVDPYCCNNAWDDKCQQIYWKEF